MKFSRKQRPVSERYFERILDCGRWLARRPKSSVGYRASHRRLLINVANCSPEGRSIRLGCIFVPVSRSFGEELPGLRLATELALAQDCHLMISCSKKAKSAEFPSDLANRLGQRLVLLNHAEVHGEWHPGLDSFRQRASKFHRSNDAGDKRNLALSLAVCLGWQSILFLDDDIFSLADGPTLDPAGLQRALSTLHERPEMRVLGWSATDFPDNSVIGHARRLAALKQEVFIGAGAVLVRTDSKVSYFPNIYNQDWLFVIAQTLASQFPRRAIGWAGSVGQTPYHPFRASRARAEETGDVIGEGLCNLFEDHGPKFESLATASFWQSSLEARRELISRLRLKIGRLTLPNTSWSGEKVSHALTAAAKVNAQFDAEELASYVRAWREDEGWWHYHLESLKKLLGERPEPPRVLEAVRAGRPPSARLGSQSLPSMRGETKRLNVASKAASGMAAVSTGAVAPEPEPVRV